MLHALTGAATLRPLGLVRRIPVLQSRDGGVFVIGRDADQCAAKEKGGDQQEAVANADGVGIDIGYEKINEERRGKAERSHGNAFEQ